MPQGTYLGGLSHEQSELVNEHDKIPPFAGTHDPILVPAAKFDSWQTYWKWWCPCGKGGGVDDYAGASISAIAHAEAKNAQAQS